MGFAEDARQFNKAFKRGRRPWLGLCRRWLLSIAFAGREEGDCDEGGPTDLTAVRGNHGSS